MDLNTARTLHRAGRRAEAAGAYQALLARDPDNAEALHGLGVLRHQAGAGEDAVALIGRAIALQPRDAVFHFNFGLALYRLGRFDAAADAFRAAAREKPDWPQPHYDLGNALHAAGWPEEAARAYRAALKLKPDYVQAEVNLANVLKADGKRAQAIAAYRRVLRRDPNLPEVHNNLGAALLDDGDRVGAEASFRAAIARRPGFAEALGNLAALLVGAARFAEAVPLAEAARAAAPDRAGLCELHADALRGAEKFDDAITAYRAALALQPDRVSAQFGMAEAFRLKRDLDAAEAILRPLAEAFPNVWQAQHDLANVVRHQGRFAEAEAGFRAALALREAVATLAPLGMVLRDLQRLPESTAVLERALHLAPDDLDASYNLATTHLTAGRLREGFALYDTRLTKFRPRKVAGRAWTGEKVRGRTVLVTAEQGLGDTIHFLRYVPALAAAGARVVLRVQPPLLRLVQGFPGVAALADDEAALAPYDLHVPIMSLPHRLGIADPAPLRLPYLAADPDLVAAWRARLAALPGRRVGLVWRGNPGFGGDHLRSIPPQRLAGLGAVPGISLVSLQKDAAALPPVAIADWTAELGDFADTAALVTALDLVISVDTAVAHLAGALGRPVWLLNRFDTCWRWLIEREDSIWYPTMRIFRQDAPGDWSQPLRQVVASLRQVAASPAEPAAPP
jgi:tetratricopeptide (TPR) repeat protein